MRITRPCIHPAVFAAAGALLAAAPVYGQLGHPDMRGLEVRLDAQATADAQALGGALADALVFRMYVQYFDTAPGGNPYVVLGITDTIAVADQGALFHAPVPFGGDTAPNSGLFPFEPSLPYDSFVTLNALADNPSVVVDADFAWGARGVAAGGWFNNAPANLLGQSALNTDNGYWETLLAQFTLTGVAPGEAVRWGGISLITFNSGVGTQAFQVFVVPPSPGAAALLAFAGVAAMRRRR